MAEKEKKIERERERERDRAWPQHNTRDSKKACCTSEALLSVRMFEAKCKPGPRVISHLGNG